MFCSYSFFEKIAVALLSLVLSLGAFVYVSAQSMRIDRQGFELEAQSKINRVRSGLDVVDGIATSLRALPFSKLDPSRVSSYARSVIGDYAFITGFGRFEYVPGQWIDGFVEGMRKLPDTKNFSLWWSSDVGKPVFRSDVLADDVKSRLATKMWYPVTLTAGESKNSMQSVSLNGFDVGSLESFMSSVSEAAISGNTTLASTPQVWQKPGQVLALRISYGSQLLPQAINERKTQADGGYWLALDMTRLGASDVDNGSLGLSLEMFDATAEFAAHSDTEVLYSRSANPTALLFSRWFGGNEWLSSFNLGDKTLILRVSRQSGFTLSGLFSALLCFFLVLTFAFVIFILNGKRRYEQQLQRQQSEQLYSEQHRATVTLASIGDAVITTDVTGCIQYANHAAEKMLAASADHVRGKPIRMLRLLSDSASESTVTHDQLGFQSDISLNFDRNLNGPNGSVLVVNQTISPLMDMNGERSGCVIVLRDVSAEKELTRRLEHRVNHDALTGLANRVQFEDCLSRLFRTSNENESHAICYIDLDRFKQINDTCGHAAGDRLLKELSTAMQSKVRGQDVLARLGGDEFGIVLSHCDPASAELVVQRIHELFSGFNFEHSGKLFPVRGSIGLVNFNPAKTTLENVLNVADAACYTSKRKGSNHIQINSAHEADDVIENVEELWVPRIQSALKNNGFELFLQPIAAIAGEGRSLPVAHHEFLLRMKGSDGQLVYPGNFIKSAERCGYMGEIDLWVIDNSLAHVAGLRVPMSEHLFSVNLSGQAVKNSELFSRIRDAVEHYGVKPDQLCFEVREVDVLNNHEPAIELFQRLRDFGCKTALDDFGAGLSSFTGLNRLSVDFIKIDERFLTSISTSANDQRLLRSLAGFASSMGTQTIAEKVESLDLIEVLAANQIDFVQGYAIGYPQSISSEYTSINSAA